MRVWERDRAKRSPAVSGPVGCVAGVLIRAPKHCTVVVRQLGELNGARAADAGHRLS